MQENIEKILYNVTDENIAKMGIMLADADKNLMNAEISLAIAKQNISAPIDQSILGELGKAMTPKDIQNAMNDLNKQRELAVKDAEKKVLASKSEYRTIAIAFDTLKLIVQNKSIKS